MVDYNRVLQGFLEYMDHELTPKLSGVQKWVFGAATSIAVKKARELYNSLKENELLKTLDIIQGDMVNIDLLHQELLEQAEKTPITINITYLGNFKFNKEDVELVYQYIKREV